MALFVSKRRVLFRIAQKGGELPKQLIREANMQTETGHATAMGKAQANGPQTWEVGGRTYTTYREYLEARDRRTREFLMLAGRVGPDEVGPPLVVPEGATPENFNPEPVWPVSDAIDAAFAERFRLVTAAELNSSQYETRYLIPGILAAGQPGGIFGPFKSLKTSLAADLLISLASGTPFLGRFAVTEPGKVLFLAGEAGLPAVRSIARRICAERGLSLEALDNFVVSPDLPRLDRPGDLMILEELIRKQKAVCVVIDPAYLALGEQNSRNLFAMGTLLRPLAKLCESTGCSVLLVHHAKRSHKAGSPPTLDDIAWSGFAEFSSQWLLVSRRRAYNPDTGRHELWLSAGSRAGNQGLWALDVYEGASPHLPDAGPIACASEDRRPWKACLKSVAWAEAQADEQFVASSEDRRLRRRALAVERQSQRLLELLAAHPDGLTARFMRDELGLSGDRMSRLLDALIEKGEVTKSEERYDRRRMIATYTRVPRIDLSQPGWGNAPAPGAVGVGRDGTRSAAAHGSCAGSTSAVGRDTKIDRENSGDLVRTQTQHEAASSGSSSPTPAAPGVAGTASGGTGHVV
jgi:hypothetical protein